jgi:hypothetical protein
MAEAGQQQPRISDIDPAEGDLARVRRTIASGRHFHR